MTYLLSRAVLEDLPEMISWEGALFGTDAWSPEVMVAELSHSASYYVVARPDGDDAIVGYAGLRAGNSGGDGDIQTVAVAPEHRGKGLGRLLVEALLSEARQRLASSVFLGCALTMMRPVASIRAWDSKKLTVAPGTTNQTALTPS